MAWGISSTLSTIEAGVFIERSVRELLFEGYQDTLLAIAEMVGQQADIPLDRFGWFYKVRISCNVLSSCLAPILGTCMHAFVV